MRQIYYSGQFKKDVKQAQKRGESIKKLKFLISLIIENKPLPARYRNHPLKGQWRGFRDAHVEPDWILIYKDDDKFVRFERTGKHSDLFNE